MAAEPRIFFLVRQRERLALRRPAAFAGKSVDIKRYRTRDLARVQRARSGTLARRFFGGARSQREFSDAARR